MNKLRRILVVDGSRVVRVTLTKHLKEDFEIIEEANGESAWQTLMLDATISAVVSGIHLPKLEAHDLIARLRASSLRRLKELPFTLIVSDVDNQADREFDRTCGVTGFITKTMKKAAIVACLNALFEEGGEATSVVAEEKVQRNSPPNVVPLFAPTPEPEKLLDSEAFWSVLTGLSFAEAPTEPVCALVFGIDDRDGLIERFGNDVAGLIAARFANLLLSKLTPLDVIGRCRGERLAIISRSVDLKQGVRFGKQVCKSLASGQITIRGQKVKLTASVGVASTSDDALTSGSELFFLADQRLDQALVCGGNTVATEYKPKCPLHCREKDVFEMLDALMVRKGMNLAGNVGTLGLKIMPLLQVINQELALGLPLTEIRKQLQQRASSEEATA